MELVRGENMYEQSINDVKVVVIPLDGTILDLNRYRYNYYHHLCESKHLDLDKHVFYSHLSNMYDMYRGLPLSNEIDTGPLNNRLERELYQYLAYKGMKPKEGCLELIEYLHQKNIYIAIISTHRTKDAVQYLKELSLYEHVHFIIGSDTSSMPLPSTQMLETIAGHFGVKNQEMLVISSFMALNYAANELHMNVIYCEDLVKADMREKETSYKTVSSLFEVLNTFLFDRYEEVEMYSPILGMNSTMSKQELDDVKAKLEVTYKDDPQILDLVMRTYTFHVSQLGRQNIKDASASVVTPLVQPRKRFQFEDEVSLADLQTLSTDIFREEKRPQKENKIEKVLQEEPTEKKENENSKEKGILEGLYDLTPEPTTFIKEVPKEEAKPRRFFKDNLFKKENKNNNRDVKPEVKREPSSPSSMSAEEINDLLTVLNQIDDNSPSQGDDDTFLQKVNSKSNKITKKKKEPHVKKESSVKKDIQTKKETLAEVQDQTSKFDIRRQIFDDEDEEDYVDKMEENSVIMTALIQVVSVFAISFMLLFIGVIVYVALINQFTDKNSFFGIIAMIFDGYFTVIDIFFKFIFDGLSRFLPFIPPYSEYVNSNTIFSPDGVRMFNIFVFHCFVIIGIKAIMYIMRRRINEKAYS